MADWNAIKTEYITTDTSYRKLGEKHGIGYSVIGERARLEGWVEQREQFRNKTLTKTVDAISTKQVDRAAKLISVADLLLDRVKSLVEGNPELLINTQSIKNLSGVLKDIKEVQMVRSDADMREQEARIKKLQKEAQEEAQKDNTIIIQFAEGSEEFGK